MSNFLKHHKFRDSSELWRRSIDKKLFEKFSTHHLISHQGSCYIRMLRKILRRTQRQHGISENESQWKWFVQGIHNGMWATCDIKTKIFIVLQVLKKKPFFNYSSGPKIIHLLDAWNWPIWWWSLCSVSPNTVCYWRRYWSLLMIWIKVLK